MSGHDDALSVERGGTLTRHGNTVAEQRRPRLVVTDSGRLELDQHRTNNDKTTRSGT